MTSDPAEDRMLKQCAVDNDCQELYNRFQSRYRVDLEDVMAWDSERDGHERRRRFEETVRRIYEHGNQQSNKNNKNKSIAHPRYHLAINRFADQPPRFFSPTKTWHENDDAHLLWDAILDGGTENEHDVHTSKRQPQHLRSLQRQPEANENLLVPKGSDIHPFVVKLESEADIRNVVGVAPAVELGGKIHFPMPSKKHHKKKHYKTQRLQPGSVVNLPDMGPPVKYKLGIEVAESEKEYPFGGSLPALDSPEQGHEVNLRTKHSFQPTYHDKYAMSLNWATRHNPDRVPLVHDVFDQGSCGSCWAYAATGSLETSLARRAARNAYRLVQKSNVTSDDNGSTNVTLQNVSLHQLGIGDASDLVSYAKQYARMVEKEVFDQTRLSIQELLDCDTAVDQGCVGGNPLLAFYYIHKYGLMSWQDYPYRGAQADACQRTTGGIASLSDILPNGMDASTQLPMATVDSWGMLPKNHEDLIQIALRYIGPVAAAINGADPDFISYGGGIFDKESCDQGANHAVLIVGYGEEDEHVFGQEVSRDVKKSSRPLTETVRYWIARNSWGTDWGEQGYIRIRRGPGGKKIPGICGIARSPSVALGGRALYSPWSKDTDQEAWDAATATKREQERRSASNPSDSDTTTTTTTNSNDDDFTFYRDFIDDEWPQFCDKITPMNTLVHVGCRRMVNVFDNHRAMSLFVTSILFVFCLAWPLTYPCRYRNERRKRFKSYLQQQQQQQQHARNGGAVAVTNVHDGMDGDSGGDGGDDDDDDNNYDGDEDDDDQDQDNTDTDDQPHSRSHGSLSLSSDEENALQFAILEDDLAVVDERTPMMRSGIVANPFPSARYNYLGDSYSTSNRYGSVGEEQHPGDDCDDDCEGDGDGRGGRDGYRRQTSKEAASPSAHDMAASYLTTKSTSSGRSWFFTPK